MQVTTVCASPPAWDRSRQEEIEHDIIALGLSNGAVMVQITCNNASDTPSGTPPSQYTFFLEPSKTAANSATLQHAPVASIALHVPNQSCFSPDPMWFLAVADDDSRGTTRVIDLTTVLQMVLLPALPGKGRTPAAPDKVSFEVWRSIIACYCAFPNLCRS